MLPAVAEEVRAITAKGQITAPKAVYPALGVGYGGRTGSWSDMGTIIVYALSRDETADLASIPLLSLPALLEADLAARVGDVLPDAPAAGEASLY